MSKITAHSENAWKVRCFETLKCFLPTWQLTSLHCIHYETIHCSRPVTSPLVHPKFHLHSIPFLQLLKHPLADADAITRTRVAGILGDTGSIDTCRWSAGNTCQIWYSMSRSLIQQHSSLPTILDTLVEKNATSWSSMYTCVKMCA